MHKFFQEIRRKLVTKGYLKKYLFYAVGEIVLIVIGILLAFQINNWKENKQKLKKEVVYLENLISEFEENKTLALNQVDFQNRQIKDGELLLGIYQLDSLPKDTIKFLFAIEHTGWSKPINYVKDVWIDIYSTGNINRIRSNILRKELLKFYNEIESFYDQMAEWNNYNQHYRTISKEVIDPYLRLKVTRGIYNEPLKHSEYQYKIDKIIFQFRKKEGMGSALVDVIICRKAALICFQSHLKNIESILMLLKEELNKKLK